MFDIHKWNDLQGKLKEEYNLVSSGIIIKMCHKFHENNSTIVI